MLVRAPGGSMPAFGGKYVHWTDMPEPWIVPHRGAGANIAPDNTLEAFRAGAGYKLGVVDGGDYRGLVDGTLANMHDRNMQYTTLNAASVNVDDHSGPSWKQVVVDAGRWFGGNWGSLGAPTAADILIPFGAGNLLTPEWKTDGGVATAYQDLVAMIVQAGLSKRVLFCSTSLVACQYAVAQGIPSVCWVIASPATPVATFTAQLAGQGINYVCLVQPVVDATISGFIAAGYKVTLAGGMVRQKDYAHYNSLGVSGYWSDDPLYFGSDVSKYRVTTAPWVKQGTFSHGMLSWSGDVSANRGSIVGSAGAYRWSPTIDTFMLVGPMCPLANKAGSYTLTVPVTFDTLASDTSRHADIFICQGTDDGFHNVGASTDNGYNILIRQTGQFQIFKVVAGSATLLVSSSSDTAITVAGTTATMNIAVTPTGITVDRDGAHAITTSDLAGGRGGYFFLGQAGISTGLRVSFGAVSVA